jgi:predicted component of type VI protein secretion system
MQDKARRPLREARVNITTEPGRPGSYLCVAYLRPHFQLEQLVGMLALETKPFEIELTTAASR